MANRLTQMDGEVTLNPPKESILQRAAKQPAQSDHKRGLKYEEFWSAPARNRQEQARPGQKKFTQLIHRASSISYCEFMPLDQAGPAVIAHENSKNGAFVAIKRLRINRKPISKVPDFHCNNIVNIKDIFLEADDEIVIVYEQMDVSLRHIKAVTSGPYRLSRLQQFARM